MAIKKRALFVSLLFFTSIPVSAMEIVEKEAPNDLNKFDWSGLPHEIRWKIGKYAGLDYIIVPQVLALINTFFHGRGLRDVRFNSDGTIKSDGKSGTKRWETVNRELVRELDVKPINAEYTDICRIFSLEHNGNMLEITRLGIMPWITADYSFGCSSEVPRSVVLSVDTLNDLVVVGCDDGKLSLFKAFLKLDKNKQLTLNNGSKQRVDPLKVKLMMDKLARTVYDNKEKLCLESDEYAYHQYLNEKLYGLLAQKIVVRKVQKIEGLDKMRERQALVSVQKKDDDENTFFKSEPNNERRKKFLKIGSKGLRASISKQGIIRVWRPNKGKEVYDKEVYDYGNWVQALELSPDRLYVAAGGEDGRIKIWRRSNDRRKDTVVREYDHGAPISSLTYRRDGKYLASVDQKGGVKIWKKFQDDPVGVLSCGEKVTSVEFTSSGCLVETQGSSLLKEITLLGSEGKEEEE